MPRRAQALDLTCPASPKREISLPTLLPAARARTRVVIADDQAIFRHSLRALLHSRSGFRVIGEAADATTVVSAVRRLKPDLLLLDVTMGAMAGMRALQHLRNSGLRMHIVVLSASLGKAQSVQALGLGARAVVAKNSSSDLFLEVLKKVTAGQYWLPPETLVSLIELATEKSIASRTKPNRYGLTTRECDVMNAVVAGCTNTEIAVRLGLSEQTVKHHVSHIYDKLGVYSRLELVLFTANHPLLGQMA